MNAAHGLLRMMTSNPQFAAARENLDTLTDILEDMGFEGLRRSNSFLQTQEFDKQLIGLTEKLIEVSPQQLLLHD
jgi:neurofibromin 1